VEADLRPLAVPALAHVWTRIPFDRSTGIVAQPQPPPILEDIPPLSHGRGPWIATGVMLLIFVILAGATAAFTAIRLDEARSALAQGGKDLNASRAALQGAAYLDMTGKNQKLMTTILRARRSFKAARTDLAPLHPFLPRLGWIPRFGPQLAAAVPVSDAAYYSADAAVRLLRAVAAIDRAVRRPGSDPLSVRIVPALRGRAGRLNGARSDLRIARAAVDTVPAATGNSQLDRAVTQLRAALPAAQGGADWLAAMPILLGVNRPDHLLLAWQDWKELRATGGFIAAADYLTVDRGKLSEAFSSSALPNEISVPAPLPEAMYTSEGSWLFRDSNWSPDFRLSAQLESWFYARDTGRQADGVIDFSNGAVQALLAATGPVYLPAYRQTVTARNANALSERYANGAYHGPQELPGDNERKQFIGDLTAAILARIQTLPPARWPALGKALARAIQQGSILMEDSRPVVAGAIADAGAQGAIMQSRGDYLYIVDDNRSYSRLNPYVRESARYHVDLKSSIATLWLRYHVAPSPASIEGVGPMFGSEGNKHDYQDFLRVYVPAGSKLLASFGLARWAPDQVYGHTQLAGRVYVPEGQTRTVTLRYRLPATATAGPYSLTIQRQPEGNLHSVHVTVTRRATIDRHLVARLRSATTIIGPGARNAAPRVVPLSQLGRDPYLPYKAVPGLPAGPPTHATDQPAVIGSTSDVTGANSAHPPCSRFGYAGGICRRLGKTARTVMHLPGLAAAAAGIVVTRQGSSPTYVEVYPEKSPCPKLVGTRGLSIFVSDARSGHAIERLRPAFELTAGQVYQASAAGSCRPVPGDNEGRPVINTPGQYAFRP